MNYTQKIYKALLPQKYFQKIKEESQQWFFVCECGFEKSVWDAGGLRHMWSKNNTEPRQSGQYNFWRCPVCDKLKWRQLVYKV